MNPPFKKKKIDAAIASLAVGIPNQLALYGAVMPITQKINKAGPFELTKVTEEYHYFSHLLNGIVRDHIRELPDFSDDSAVAVMSDFGGEHSGARFNTYSFLFVAFNKAGVFEKEIGELRKRYGLLAPYSEFAYKKLTSGARSRALPEYLELVDQFVHGAIITLAIDKQIDTVFGTEKKQAHPVMVDHLQSAGLGEWAGPVAEKVLRVANIIAAFIELLTHENQKFFWYSDNDSINVDGNKRNFEHTQQIFVQTLGMYLTHKLDLVGFGKSFEDRSHLDDLLSIPDLAAGVVQDLLFQYKTGADVPGGKEKEAVMRWIATPARYLSKIHLQITKAADGQIHYGAVDLKVIEP